MEFRSGNLSVNDGFLFGGFQKVIPVLFQFGKRFSCGYIEIGLISDFLDVDRERDLIELVDDLVDLTKLRSI